MVYVFSNIPINPNLGKILEGLGRVKFGKYILFGIYYSPLVHFMAIW
jgi:hypothetical protein